MMILMQFKSFTNIEPDYQEEEEGASWTNASERKWTKLFGGSCLLI
jgi:hypothetical protein